MPVSLRLCGFAWNLNISREAAKFLGSPAHIGAIVSDVFGFGSGLLPPASRASQ
jgi:hypothetical protein